MNSLLLRIATRSCGRLARCAALGCAAVALSGALANEARRPNIVFILADDVGREVLGCYGAQSYETPNQQKAIAHRLAQRFGYAQRHRQAA